MPQGTWVLLLFVFVVAGVNLELAFGATESNSSAIHSHQQLIRSFEKRLLTMFGLQSRPRPKKNVTVSNYMWELYNQQTRFQRMGLYSKTTTIRCFRSQAKNNKSEEDTLRTRYKFKVSSIPDHEEVWAAELVIYRHSPEPNPSVGRTPIHRLLVFDVLQPASKTAEARLRLVDTRVLKSLRSEWESFDVLPALQRWIRDPIANYGLYVELANSLNSTFAARHVRLKRSADESHEQWLQWQPMLVIYSRDSTSLSSSSTKLSRSRRSTRKHRRKGRKDNCRRHALYVDFSDVGWNDWIVAPPGYDAYFCHGECPYPLADHLNSTNHAIVQTIVNSVYPKSVPRTCCVPTELSTISMLYVDEYDKIVLKNYQDMVVEGCGCR